MPAVNPCRAGARLLVALLLQRPVGECQKQPSNGTLSAELPLVNTIGPLKHTAPVQWTSRAWRHHPATMSGDSLRVSM